jgi:hypothetical protein
MELRYSHSQLHYLNLKCDALSWRILKCITDIAKPFREPSDVCVSYNPSNYRDRTHHCLFLKYNAAVAPASEV